MIYSFNNKEYPIEIIKKNNKNTYIRVRKGTIIVTTNYFVTPKQIDNLITSNKDAINKMIMQDSKKQSKEEDNKFYLFGKYYDIKFDKEIKETVVQDNLMIFESDKKFQKFLNNYITKVFAKHLNYWYNIFEENIPVPNLKIRKMKSRWGVCNLKNNNVTLNLDLYKYDITCLDYVIVHELSHFIYPNHSKDFWNLVSKYYPNYKEIRKKLRG